MCLLRRERIERLEKENVQLIHELRLQQERRDLLERRWREEILLVKSRHADNISHIAKSLRKASNRKNRGFFICIYLITPLYIF